MLNLLQYIQLIYYYDKSSNFALMINLTTMKKEDDKSPSKDPSDLANDQKHDYEQTQHEARGYIQHKWHVSPIDP